MQKCALVVEATNYRKVRSTDCETYNSSNADEVRNLTENFRYVIYGN